MRDAQLPTPALHPAKPSLTLPDKLPTAPRVGPFFAVQAIDLTGNTLFPADRFNALIDQIVGPSVSLGDLESLATAIDRFYLAQGYLARTVVPEQEIGNGRVRLHVIEAQLGEVSIKTPDEGVRFDTGKARRIASEGQTAGHALDVTELEGAMQVLSGMPGVAADAQLVPSVTVEGTDVVVRMRNTELVNNGLIIDNRGSRYSGRERLLYSLVLNGPFSSGDQLSAVGVISEGTRILSLTGSVPVSDGGARLSVTGSHLEYDLVDTLDSDGSADSVYVQLSQPQLFSRRLGSYERLSVGVSHLRDFVLNTETTDKRVFTLAGESSGVLSLNNESTSANYRLTATLGSVELSGNASDAIADRNTARTEGGFAKLNLAADVRHELSTRQHLHLSAEAQWAAKNLDSSQKMSLGGLDGVRAYPTGEASGDHAVLIRGELHHRARPGLSVYGFVDAGWVRLNRRTWTGWNSGNTGLKNRYRLAGLGAGLSWQPSPRVSANAVVASRIGDNPGADINDRDGDGRRNRQRAWLEISMKF